MVAHRKCFKGRRCYGAKPRSDALHCGAHSSRLHLSNWIAANHPASKAGIDQHLFALMRQILYGAACNRIHSMEERCARWLLMTHDRAGDIGLLPLTQDSIAHAGVECGDQQ